MAKEVEIKVKNIQAYDKSCLGCVNNEADIMIGCLRDDDGDDTIAFVDLFMSKKVAQRLHKSLGKY